MTLATLEAPLRQTDFLALEAEYGARNYKPLDVVLTRGEGVYVWDVDGKRYLDGLSAYSLSLIHIYPAERLDVQRRLIVASEGVEGEIEHL